MPLLPASLTVYMPFGCCHDQAVCITKSLPSTKWVEVHREEREEPWGRAVLIIQQKRE